MKFNTRLWGILLAGMPLVCSFSEGTEERFSERLLVEVSAREYHVSVKGNDRNPGTRKAPFRTIGKAASLAVAGDVITVHEGTYRERIDPPRGGEENRPIVYQAAEGEHVEVKGSEIIKGWVRQNAHAWKVSLPNSYWKGFNPYADCLNGDWLESGQWCHTGEVYLQGKALRETPSLEQVMAQPGDTAYWHCQVTADSTFIWAHFATDPNEATVEINVRQSVFYPSRPFVNYIHVKGFTLRHAATPWAPPTAEQIGLIGTHWSKGWVIEDNIVSDSKCVGITLGKYGDEWDNKSESAEAFVHTTERALQNGWDREHVGSHTVRRNRVTHCGQAGIAGSLGAAFSRVEDNIIAEISTEQQFWGYELAGIKFHGAVDAVIAHNHIYHTEGGIWLDWMTQGTRITRNLLHDNRVQDFSLEVNHGPVLVDHNLFLSEELAQVKLSQGVAFVNNLIAWKIWPTPQVDNRQTPYLVPHGTAIVGLHDCPCGNTTYANNIFTRIDLTPYDEALLPVKMSGNLYLGEAVPSRQEQGAIRVEAPCQKPLVEERADGWYLRMEVPAQWRQAADASVRTTADLPEAVIPRQSFHSEGEVPVVFDTDYLGIRKPSGVCCGPMEFAAVGIQTVKVYSH